MYRKLLKDSTIYGLGAILIKSFAFFTLPIYTRVFTPAEYGIIEMFATIGSLISIMMTMGLDSAQSYYFMEAKNKATHKIEEITTSILGLRAAIGIGIVGVVGALSPFILDFAFNTDIPKLYLLLVSLSIFFANLISQSLEIYRLVYKPWQFICLSLLQTLSSIGLILYFILVRDMGLVGYFLGMAVSYFFVLLVSWYATKDYRSFDAFNHKLWPEFLKFGAPLVPAGMSIWFMQAGDRWFVMKMLGSHELGIYAVGAKISVMLALAVSVFRQAWWPIAMDMLHKPEGIAFFRRISLLYVSAASLGVIFLALLAPLLVKILAGDEYQESYRLVGVLGWGAALYGFYMLSDLGIFKSKKTYLSVCTNFSGATLNIVLNFVFIQHYGMIGAAYATVISLLVTNVLNMYLSQKLISMKWDWLLYAAAFGVSFFIVIYLGGGL